MLWKLLLSVVIATGTALTAAAPRRFDPFDNSPTLSSSEGSLSRAGCSCGYVLTQDNDAYFPLAILVDFTQVSSTDSFPELGLKMATTRIGGINRDDEITLCRSDPANFRFTDDGMEMVVPGGQSLGGEITGAELQSVDKMTSGHLSMRAQISPVHGTCQSLFTYIDEVGFPEAGDEQDIEILGQRLDEGTLLTNYNPETYHTEYETTIVPFPNPPTIAFHNYTLTWPQADAANRTTRYYFDDDLIKSYDKWASVNPSGAYINHWSNGQKSFTQGPPVEDAVLTVRSLAWYYSTADVPGLPVGCTLQKACRVD